MKIGELSNAIINTLANANKSINMTIDCPKKKPLLIAPDVEEILSLYFVKSDKKLIDLDGDHLYFVANN